MQHFLNRLIPFVLLGVGLVAFAFGIIILAYLFLLGALVGMILFGINLIREKFRKPKTPVKKPSNRIIDSDDWKIM